MTPVLFMFMLIGIGYVSWLLMRFLVWLDGADKCGEDAAEASKGNDSGTVKERRDAA